MVQERSILSGIMKDKTTGNSGGFLYKENHSLYEWFKKAYGDEQENPVTIIERSANCTIVHNRDSLLWE